MTETDMTLGKKIKEARKSAGITRDDLADMIGFSPAAVTKIESDGLKFGPAPDTLIKIADALGDQSILVYALMHNPICQRIIPRAFVPLNNINDNPSAILAKLHEELEEAKDATEILSRIFSVKEPQNTPNYKETLLTNLEQILDVSRCVEEMFSRLKECDAMTEEEHLEVRIRQQAKVERNGHHRCDLETASERCEREHRETNGA
jgi:transcriptional regulator with XRE-family HTH domain